MSLSSTVRKRLVGASALVALVPGFAVAATSEPSSADPPARAAAATREYVIVNNNVEKKGFGNGYGQGVPTNPGSAIDFAIARAIAQDADGITLQEVCLDQYQKLVQDHPDWTISWNELGRPTHVADPYRNGCDPTDELNWIGDVAIVRKKSAAITTQVVPLDVTNDPDVRGNGPGLACVRSPLAGSSGKLMILCSTHLPAEEGQQALFAKIREVTNGWISNGHLVVLGGDFNKNVKNAGHKPQLDQLYYLNSDVPGRFNEADQTYQGGAPCRCGRDTTSASNNEWKIDYVFFSRNRVAESASRSMTIWNPRGEAVPGDTDYSDHKTLAGRAVVDLS